MKKKLFNTFFLCVSFICLHVSGMAQNREISGMVTDENNEPLPGVNVIVKGTTLGRITDLDGKFSLKIPEDAKILEFSSIGFTKVEVEIGEKVEFKIQLKEDRVGIDEVVVIGYGTLEKKELTSSVTSVKAKDLIQGISTNPVSSLQGKVTGLSVVNTNGSDPNSGVSIQLRGANSVNASQGPLVIIDGVPGGSLNSVIKEDIESIDVLKDAAAGAIYGSRAAGGVILITTKKAQQGTISSTYTAEMSIETVRKKIEVLNREEFLAHNRGEDFGHNTDWFDEVTNDNPITQRHVLTLSGGTENLSLYSSLYTKKAKGLAIGSEREEIGARINFNFKTLNGLLEVSGHSSYNRTRAQYSSNDIFKMALKLNPTISPYNKKDPTGYNIWKGGWQYYNPVASINTRESFNIKNRLLADVNFKLNITDNLNTNLMLATKYSTDDPVNWTSRQAKGMRETGKTGSAKLEHKQWLDKTVEWLTNYSQLFGNHSVRAMCGYSFQEFNRDGFWAENGNFPVDGVKWYDLSSGYDLTNNKSNLDSWKSPRDRVIAFFGRLNYNYDNKYLLSASLRKEGAAKFPTNNQWGTFPAISLGWRISEEPFMKGIDFINDLKLRGGYGETGNTGFGTGVGIRMYRPDTWWRVNGNWIKTYGSAHNVNKDLSWEVKKEWNVGLDFSLFNNRLSGKVDLYKRTSDNLIYNINVSAPPAIHDKTTMNVGELENKGIEVELTWDAYRNKDFSYLTTVRASHNQNKLVTLWGDKTYWDRKGFPSPGGPGSAVRLYPGIEIGKFYLYKYAGITNDGKWQIENKDGNVIEASNKKSEDKRHMGNGIPKLRLSWDNTFTYKNFELSLYFRSWLFYDVYNMTDMYYGVINPEHPNLTKNAVGKNKHISATKELTDYFLEDGSFIKLHSATLGYNFKIPAIKDYVRNINVYANVRNVFTLTSYSGLDPEININGLEPGFEEITAYPATRTFSLGLKVNF